MGRADYYSVSRLQSIIKESRYAVPPAVKGRRIVTLEAFVPFFFLPFGSETSTFHSHHLALAIRNGIVRLFFGFFCFSLVR